MFEPARPRDTALHRRNMGMIYLCALASFWLLASPLVPYVFDTASTAGMATFVAAQLLLTASLGAIGVTLNHLAAREVRVTVHAVRRTLRRLRHGRTPRT